MKKAGIALLILLVGFAAGVAVSRSSKDDLEARLEDQQTLMLCAAANASLLHDADLYLRLESAGSEQVREGLRQSIRANFMNVRYRDTYQNPELRRQAGRIRAETQKKLLDIFPEFKTRLPADEVVD